MKRTFYSRNGKPLSITKEIVDTMPDDIFLDGEIWYALFFHSGRGEPILGTQLAY